MANTITAIMHKILARGLSTLRETAVMPRLVNADFSMEARQKGDTIDIPIGAAVGTQAITPAPNNPSNVDHAPSKVSIALDDWRGSDPIHLTDKEMVEIDKREHFLPLQMAEAVRGLANYINAKIMGSYVDDEHGIYGFYGTPGTTPFASDGVKPATQGRALLNKQIAPTDGRRGVLDFDAEAAALELSAFSDAEKVGSADVKLRGEVGMKFGTLWLADHQVPTHTAGTIDDGNSGRTCAVNNGAGYAAGVSAINVNNGAESQAVGTIKRGDIIKFAGHDQTYCVISNTSSGQFNDTNKEYTFSSNAIAGLTFYPALQSAVADNEVITVEDTHVVNLLFHRDAFGYAQRAMQLRSESGQRNFATMQDPVTGLILRLEMMGQYKQDMWQFDVLFGNRLVRPQYAVRIAG